MGVDHSPSSDSRQSLAQRLQQGLRFGLVELVDHTGPWIVAGLLLAALLLCCIGLATVHSASAELGIDYLPRADTLVIEAQVTPNDIDVVHAGLPAQVRLTAFKQRDTPMLDGELTRVSADSFTDERSGASYFLARITIDAAEIKKLDGRELYPGMGSEVMIKTGKRTTMDYILAPLTDSLRRAFRED